MNDPYDLPNLPTKVLLNYLQGARKRRGRYYPVPGQRAIFKSEIKAELAKREYVPNKDDARAIRQENAYRGKARRNRRKKLKKQRGW